MSGSDLPPIVPEPLPPPSPPGSPIPSPRMEGDALSLKPLGRGSTVLVRGPNGTKEEVSSGKKWVITALKVLLVAVLVGGFVAASVFTFGAAGAFGAAAATTMGVTTTAIAGAVNTLYVTGGALVGVGLIAIPLLAHKNKMGKYTGEDKVNAQQFLLGGIRAISNIVKKVFNSAFFTNLILGSDSAEIEKKRRVCQEIIERTCAGKEITLNSDSKKVLAEAFEKLHSEQKAILPEETQRSLEKAIQELRDKEDKRLTDESHGFISRAVAYRNYVQIDSPSLAPFKENPALILRILLSMFSENA